MSYETPLSAIKYQNGSTSSCIPLHFRLAEKKRKDEKWAAKHDLYDDMIKIDFDNEIIPLEHDAFSASVFSSQAKRSFRLERNGSSATAIPTLLPK